MTVALRPIRDDELPAWLEHHRRWYAADLAAHGGLDEAAAAAKAARDVAALRPGGRPAEGSVLLFVGEDGEPAGSVWFAERDGPEGRHAFLYAIEIGERRRGRRLGREAMRLFEAEARARGFRSAVLNVFGGNAVARGLYRSLGWEESSAHMRKALA